MALTLCNFFGAETGGAEEATSTSGSPDFTEATVVRTGVRSLKLVGAATQATASFSIDGIVAAADTNLIIGFGFYCTDTTPGTAYKFLDDTSYAGFSLRLATDGDVEILNDADSVVATATTPFTNSTWHFVELYIQNAASGNAELFVDAGTGDSNVASASSQDFFAGSAADEIQFGGPGSGDGDVYVDDVYILTGATAASDRYGKDFAVKGYQVDSGSTTNGSALDTNNWSDTGNLPFAGATAAIYTTNNANGSADTDGTGGRVGPNTDGDVSGATIKGAKWIFNALRNTGSNSQPFLRYGDTGGTTDTGDILTTSFAIYEYLSESTNVPSDAQEFRLGCGKNAGGRDVFLYDAIGCLAYVAASAGATINVPQAALSLSTVAPTVTQQLLVEVPQATLSLSTVAPEVSLGFTVEVPKASLSLSTVAPEVTQQKVIEVPQAALALTAYTPLVTQDITVEVPQASLTFATVAPNVNVGFTVEVPQASLSLSTAVPSVTADFLAEVPQAALTLASVAPTVTVQHVIEVPQAALTLSTVTPTVYAGFTVEVPQAALSLGTATPEVTQQQVIEVPQAALVLSTVAPEVTEVAGSITIEIPQASLSLTAATPTVTQAILVEIPQAALSLSTAAPTATQQKSVEVPQAALVLASVAPDVTQQIRVEIPKADLTLSTVAPEVTESAGEVTIEIPQATLTLSSVAPTVTADFLVEVPQATFSLSTVAPLFTQQIQIEVPKASLAFTTYAPTLTKHYELGLATETDTALAIAASKAGGVTPNVAHEVYIRNANGVWELTRIVFTGTDFGAPS